MAVNHHPTPSVLNVDRLHARPPNEGVRKLHASPKYIIFGNPPHRSVCPCTPPSLAGPFKHVDVLTQ
eukprot:6315476-Prymnesium_polylepis.1